MLSTDPNNRISLDWLSRSFMIICVHIQRPYGPLVSPYSYCMVPSLYYKDVHWWLSPLIGANQQRKMNSKVARRTVAVRGNRGTVQQLDGDTDDFNRPNRPVQADSKVVKTLWTVLCSSHDGVPFKLKKENGRPGSFKLLIDWYHFWPLLAANGQYL